MRSPIQMHGEISDPRGAVLDSETGFAPQMGRPTPWAMGVEVNYLMCYGDVKINVPADAKAVYIGTIVYQHDFKNTRKNRYGYPSRRVVVRDEYDAAMAELAAMKIPGLTPKDVVKRIAVVVRDK